MCERVEKSNSRLVERLCFKNITRTRLNFTLAYVIRTHAFVEGRKLPLGSMDAMATRAL